MLTHEIVSLLNAQTLQTPARTPTPELDKFAFLQLLTKQLSMQDPLDPMSNEEFVSQLALFSQVEQTINLNTSFNQFLAFQQLTQASTLLGKHVICLVQTDDAVYPVKGYVEQVIMVNGTPYLKLSDGSEVELTTVVAVETSDGGDS
ncbi:MAG TPA: flagellar hook capping protein [Firmicutes bacterium]|nr:flagellar hook capping protein [Bacillota bacterium]